MKGRLRQVVLGVLVVVALVAADRVVQARGLDASKVLETAIAGFGVEESQLALKTIETRAGWTGMHVAGEYWVEQPDGSPNGIVTVEVRRSLAFTPWITTSYSYER